MFAFFQKYVKFREFLKFYFKVIYGPIFTKFSGNPSTVKTVNAKKLSKNSWEKKLS